MKLKYARRGQVGVVLLLLSGLLLLSSTLSQAQVPKHFSTDLVDIAGAIPPHAEPEIKQALNTLTTTHAFRLPLLTYYHGSIFAQTLPGNVRSFLKADDPALLLVVFTEPSNLNYHHCEVAVTEALQDQLSPQMAHHLFDQEMQRWAETRPDQQSALRLGILDGLQALNDYLSGLPAPDSIPTITFANPKEATATLPAGLDAFTHEAHRGNYEPLEINEEPYPVAWKALPSHQSNTVMAQVAEGVTFPPGVIFKQNDNLIPTQPAAQTHQRQVNLIGQGDEQEGSVAVYANDSEEAERVGQLNTVSYDVLPRKLVLVPLDGEYDHRELWPMLERVARIYQQAAVHLEVAIAEPVMMEGWERDHVLDDVTTGLLSNYTKEMRQVIRAFRRQQETDPETAYIFLDYQSKSGKRGYMPKKRQYGFVFDEPHRNYWELSTTIAHELGHGLFRLEHSFDTYPSLTQGSSRNLMDYGGGIKLRKYQWDLIHNPERMLGWFQDEKDAAMEAAVEELSFDEAIFTVGQGQAMITVVTPAGKPIQIPENSDRYYSSRDEEVPPGALVAFRYDGEVYIGRQYQGQFKGYRGRENGLLWGDQDEWQPSALAETNLPIHYGQCQAGGEVEAEGYCSKPSVLNANGSGAFTAIEIRDAEGAVVSFPNCRCERLYAEYQDSPLMQSSILSSLVAQDHCVLQGMKTTGEGLGYETEFMQGLNTMMGGFTVMFAATTGSTVLLPVLAANLGITVTEEVLVEQAMSRSKDFAMGFVVDGLIQTLIIRLSDDETASLDYYQMTASGVENTLDNAYLSVVISCGFDAMFENGELKDWQVIAQWDETGWDCMLGSLSALAGEGGSRLVGAGAGALLRSIKNNPDKLADLLRELGLNEESINRLLDKFGGGINVSRNTIFKAGDNIDGKVIVQVRAGTNGKIAIIGRKMDGHVNRVVSSLQSEGKQVEAFNDTFQSSTTFNIDGNTYSWQEIVDDFRNENGQYATNSQGWIIDDALPNTLMYKANREWVQKLISEGYEVIDIGYPSNVNTLSLFYQMELDTLFP